MMSDALRARGGRRRALGRPGLRDRVAAAPSGGRSASATSAWPDYRPGKPAEPRRVEVVAADLVDLREQDVEVVERVEEAGRSARRRRRSRGGDQLRRSLGVDGCDPLPASGSQLRPASDSVRCRVISVAVNPGATEKTPDAVLGERRGECLGEARQRRLPAGVAGLVRRRPDAPRSSSR